MKTALLLGLAVLLLASAHAQVFRPEAVNGAMLGSIAGAVIGHNSGDLRHNGWKGAAIGAGAGLILGEAIGNARASRRSVSTGDYYASGAPSYIYRNDSAPAVHLGYRSGYGSHGAHRHFGYGHRGYHGRSHAWGYYGPAYRYVPSYGYYDGYGVDYPYHGSYGGSAATHGLLLGALAGGIIGHNSGELHHDAWRGAAWGAGLGWLLGSVADARRGHALHEGQAVAVSAPAPVIQTTAAPLVAPASMAAPVRPSAPAVAPSPMSSANRLFGRN